MSTWGERAHRAAEALDMEAIEATDPEDVQYGFREGARWQREALLSDETVERVARALYAEDVNESTDTPWPDYDSPKNVGRPLYEERARNALLAAIGDDDEWADANPKPHTITREQFDAAEKRYWNYVHSNGDADLALLAAFHSAGIEVEDDDE